MMTMTYEVGNGLYINLTNRCTNRCDFCIRHNGAGAYGSDSLWLDREPTRDEVLADIEKRDPSKYAEIVFCGYGEPCCRLDDMLYICREIRKRWKTPIRLNTNGQASLIYGRDTAPMFEGCFDTVSVSLNSPDAKGYDAVCHSDFGEAAYSGLIEFAKELKKYVPHVVFSVVRGPLTDAQIEVCQKTADAAGIPLRVREYIG